jgi:hypothetical protein
MVLWRQDMTFIRQQCNDYVSTTVVTASLVKRSGMRGWAQDVAKLQPD